LAVFPGSVDLKGCQRQQVAAADSFIISFGFGATV